MARAATTSDAFNAIAEPRRRDILTLLRSGERAVADLAGELAAMEAAGASYTDLGDTEKAALDTTWREGVWGLASSISGTDADDLRAMLKEHGLTD